uniref:Uncharacterized protein n=1 Tax=Arundo donax TaxID=35708 RepID=A0A0A9FRI3_ARUDO
MLLFACVHCRLPKRKFDVTEMDRLLT